MKSAPGKVRLRAAALLLASAATLGASGESARFEKLGHRLMCTCGCDQVLLECNHVGCTASDGMIEKLKARLASGEANSAILAAFVEEDGPIVLAAPTTKGFDLLAWIAPYAAFILGIGLTIAIVFFWKRRGEAQAGFSGMGDGASAIGGGGGGNAMGAASTDLDAKAAAIRERVREETGEL